jgi:large subunit ribosomal protein L13
MATFVPSAKDIKRDWFLMDAENVVIGRLATEAARRLAGKHKPTYTTFLDTGDHVIIVNAAKVAFTGRKLEGKIYRRHSGYMGGLSETPAKDLIAKRPVKAVEEAIKGMLPKTKLGNAMYTKLKVYAGASHRHQAQRPQTINLKTK